MRFYKSAFYFLNFYEYLLYNFIMLKCKNCGEKLTKFNKEICPYCGCKEPLSESSQETDTTKAIQVVNDSSLIVNKKSLKVFILLTCFLGIFGIEFAYLNKIKEFLISLLINLILYIVFFIIFYFLNLSVYLFILIPILILFLLNIIFAGILYFNKNLIKDSNGVNLK